MRLIFCKPDELAQVKSEEHNFYSEVDVKVFGYITNWAKFRLYDKKNKKDAFSTYELKKLFKDSAVKKEDPLGVQFD